MYTTEVLFLLKELQDEQLAEDAISSFLGSLRMNGQILGREFPIGKEGLNYRAFVLISEVNSLDKGIPNNYVSKDICKFEEVGLTFLYKIIGKEINCAPACTCDSPNSYFLYTNYLSLESPLRCGDCFGINPLYRIPHSYDSEYYDIICWQSDYHACDNLQMNCSIGERFGTQQLSKHNSRLSQKGIEICKKKSQSTGIKTYYYLYRYTSLGKKAELNRKCPSCGGKWLLDKQLHNIFDFRCDKCSLLSNISFSII